MCVHAHARAHAHTHTHSGNAVRKDYEWYDGTDNNAAAVKSLTPEQAAAVTKTGLTLQELKVASPSLLDRLGTEVGCSAKEIILVKASVAATFGASAVHCSFAELRTEISELKAMVVALLAK